MIGAVMPRPCALLVCLVIAGCGGGAASGSATPDGTPAEISVLFMGNSHTSFNNLPEMVAAMIGAARPGQTVAVAEAPGWMFLEERASDPGSLALLRDGSWDFVVLQAQKYSTSGQYTYSTAGAESLIRAARAGGAVPVLFPEWPRRGVAETEQVYQLHAAIAGREPACVAPVGQAWDRARAAFPGLVLHADDGNHSAPAGALLTALVLAATITGASPVGFNNYFPQFGVAAEVQLQLRTIAAETVRAVPPRSMCPDDAVRP
jgi:hypothetical protein